MLSVDLMGNFTLDTALELRTSVILNPVLAVGVLM